MQLSPPVMLERTLQLGALGFNLVRYRAGTAHPRHAHSEASLILQLEGTVLLECEQQSQTVEPWALTLVPAHGFHANRFPQDGRTLEIVLGAGWLERYPCAPRLAGTWRELRGGDGGPSAWLAVRLLREFHNPDDLAPLALEGLLLELLAQMARDTGSTGAAGPEGGAPPRWLGCVKDFLHAHFREGPSLDAVAAAAGVHPDHLTRAFRRHLRCTIGEYTRSLRVEHAARLLRATALPLVQVALEAGFADQGHFTRTFKAATAMTPAEYRRATSAHAGMR